MFMFALNSVKRILAADIVFHNSFISSSFIPAFM